MLLMNDGELAHRLTHPSYGVLKTYLADVPGPVPRDLGRRLLSGIELDDGVADRQYLREVLQAERLAVVGRFARSIVHDLKNPLNIIGLTAEMAGMDQTTAEARQKALPTSGIKSIALMIWWGKSWILPRARRRSWCCRRSIIGLLSRVVVDELSAEAALEIGCHRIREPATGDRVATQSEAAAAGVLQPGRQRGRCHAPRRTDRAAVWLASGR